MKSFTTARGRPRRIIPQHDLGTPELRLKHALRLTSEPIDICLEKQIISPEQHWCALHLRWLHTIRYGAPQLTTRYQDNISTCVPPNDSNTEWRTNREKEYNDAICLLKKESTYEQIISVAIFNELPAFLNTRLQESAQQKPFLHMALNQCQKDLHDGLQLLASHWRK